MVFHGVARLVMWCVTGIFVVTQQHSEYTIYQSIMYCIAFHFAELIAKFAINAWFFLYDSSARAPSVKAVIFARYDGLIEKNTQTKAKKQT